jgi:LmbE family N-acetylglucosaminyl deacetylase
MDRVLIFAPHPDDESLATGGLVQRAFAGGSAVRIVFATNGENNPWPQRVLERRWRISSSDRARWGILRRNEAQAAIACLGGDESTACFLGFPDQGLTQILMRSRDAMVARLTRQILDWHPTLVLLPAAEDAHPDHSALHVLVRFALDLIGGKQMRVLEYFVHRPARCALWPAITLVLTPGEVAIKLAAILRHESQTALSYRRFTAFAERHEVFRASGFVDDSPEAGPIRFAELSGSTLRVVLRRPLFPGAKLLIAWQTFPRASSCWSLRLPATSGLICLSDEGTGSLRARATVRRRGSVADVRIALGTSVPVRRAFVKFRTPSFSRNDLGWRAVFVSSRADRSREVANRDSEVKEGALDSYPMTAGTGAARRECVDAT